MAWWIQSKKLGRRLPKKKNSGMPLKTECDDLVSLVLKKFIISVINEDLRSMSLGPGWR